MSVKSKILSFHYNIPNDLIKKGEHEVYVNYKLFWNGNIEIIKTAYHPDVTPLITDYISLNELIKAAAEADSKKYLAPGKYRGARQIPQPGEDPVFDERIK